MVQNTLHVQVKRCNSSQRTVGL